MTDIQEEPAEPGHSPAKYDLMAWNDDQRKALEMHLHGADLSFGWQDDGFLVVAEAVATQVEAFIELVEANDALAETPS